MKKLNVFFLAFLYVAGVSAGSILLIYIISLFFYFAEGGRQGSVIEEVEQLKNFIILLVLFSFLLVKSVRKSPKEIYARPLVQEAVKLLKKFINEK